MAPGARAGETEFGIAPYVVNTRRSFLTSPSESEATGRSWNFAPLPSWRRLYSRSVSGRAKWDCLLVDLLDGSSIADLHSLET